MSSIFFVGLFSICTPYKVFLNLLPILIGWVFLLLYLTTEFIQFLINTGIKPYIQVLFFFFFFLTVVVVIIQELTVTKN